MKKKTKKLFIIKRNYMLILYQLLSVVVASIWAFVLTFLILKGIDLIPFMKLKLSAEEEEMYIFILLNLYLYK